MPRSFARCAGNCVRRAFLARNALMTDYGTWDLITPLCASKSSSLIVSRTRSRVERVGVRRQ
jgi:hypothetical protein